MATFNIEGSSTACASGQVCLTYYYEWGEGSVVFSVQQAKKGIMEPVAIKSVRLISNCRTYGKIVPIYKDTNNWLWNEDDLCVEATAKALALAYLRQQETLLLQALANCEV